MESFQIQIVNSAYVCNGTNGQDGTDGQDGEVEIEEQHQLLVFGIEQIPHYITQSVIPTDDGNELDSVQTIIDTIVYDGGLEKD